MRRYRDPFDSDAERAVLGAIVTNERAAEQAIGELEPTDFYQESHRAAFRAAQALYERREGIDHVAVAVELASQGFAGASDARKLLFQIVEAVPTVSGLPRWIKSLKDHAMRRGVLARAEKVVEAAASSDADALAAVEELNAFATDTQEGQGVQTFADGEEDFFERVMLRKAGESVMGIPTGISRLDRASTGWHDGDLDVIAARPSIGKTAYLLQAIVTAARHGHPVFYMNLEMRFRAIQERLACAVSNVNYEKWRRGKIDAADAEKLMAGYRSLSKLPIKIHNPKAGSSIDDCKRAVRAIKPDIVFVDYLQLLAPPRGYRGDLYHNVTVVSNELKQLALAENIPVVAAAQLNRGVEDRFDKRPALSDLRESGYIEQDADRVIMLYRDSYYYPDGLRDGKPVPEFHDQKTEFIARKDREGGTWHVKAFFSPEDQWFAEEPYTKKVGVA